MNYLEKYRFWLENEYFGEKAKEELRALADNEEEIKDRFYKDLQFGTGGLRGKIGMGTNRMNIYTVSRATQGLADYLIEKAREQKDSQQYLNRGVVIAHDCRHKSREFAETTALVLNANNIKQAFLDGSGAVKFFNHRIVFYLVYVINYFIGNLGDYLPAIGPINFIAIVFRGVVAGSNHYAGCCIKMAYGKGKLRSGADILKEIGFNIVCVKD